MYCVFCPANDLAALWAYQGLKRRGLVALEIYTAEALAYNQRFEHRLWADETRTMITLTDGRVLDSVAVRGVLNRLSYLPTGHFQSASPADQSYAAQEQQAVFLSWLSAIPEPLVNRPSPRGLSGDPRSPAEWIWMAGQAGLPALPFQRSDALADESVGKMGQATFQAIVLDGDVFGTLGSIGGSIRSSISRMADLSGLRLFGVELCLDLAGMPYFASATPLPDLRLGGEPLLDKLTATLMMEEA